MTPPLLPLHKNTRLPLLATAAVLAALHVTSCLRYDNFFSARVAANLFTDNAALGIVAVGMTLVIFSGGIDLSVGAVVGFTSIFVATLVEKHHVHPALAVGTALGAGMGALIHFFRQPAFLITLAGMFLMRGDAFWINTQSAGLTHPLFNRLSLWKLPLTDRAALRMSALVLLVFLALGGLLAHMTRFGRNLLALGGNESSARLMGLPVAATRVGVYALSGFCAAFGASRSCSAPAPATRAMGRPRTRCHRGRRHRRHAPLRRTRLHVRHAAGPADFRCHPVRHPFRRHPRPGLDPHHHRHAPPRLHPPATPPAPPAGTAVKSYLLTAAENTRPR